MVNYRQGAHHSLPLLYPSNRPMFLYAVDLLITHSQRRRPIAASAGETLAFAASPRKGKLSRSD